MDNKDEIRLKTVRHLDPHVVHIVDSASRTALYSYEQDTESWSKPEVEGTLMIYSREAPPHNMIILINRLNKTNFIEPLTSNCDIQVNPPFLLFRNCKGVIYGIWFSANDNVHRISSAIRQKINQNSQPIPHAAPNIMNPPTVGGLAMGSTSGGGGSNGGGGDIMSMLSRAHGVYESKRQEPTCIVTTASTPSSDLVKPSPLRAGESNNTNVADFFAKVGMSSMGASGATLPSPSSSSGASTSTTNTVLQKLFQGAAAVGGQARVAVTAGSAPIPISGASIGASMQSHSSSISSSVPPPSEPMSLQELEGKLKENLHIAQTKDEQNVSKSHNPQNVSSLLSPQVFTRTNLQDRDLVTLGEPTPSTTASYPNIFTPLPSLGMDVKPLNGSRESLQDGLPTQLQSNITPLTHEQLVQAFSILLKKNDFVQQLHEAYIQALNQSLKGCL